MVDLVSSCGMRYAWHLFAGEAAFGIHIRFAYGHKCTDLMAQLFYFNFNQTSSDSLFNFGDDENW